MTLSNYQYSYRGITMGDGTNYDIIEINGIHDLIVKDRDRDNPRSQGMIPGIHSASFRLIRCTLEVRGTAGSTGLEDDVQALLAAMSSSEHMTPSETDDQFTFKFPGEDEKFMFARPVRRSRPRRNDTEFGLSLVRFELKVYDPRQYSITEDDSGIQTGSFSVVNNGSALAYPTIHFGVSDTGVLTLTNNTNGSVFSVSGMTASLNDIIVNGGRWIRGRGDLLIVYKGTTNYYSNWNTPRSPLELDPGSNSLTLTAATNADVRVYSRDTWM